MLYCTKFAPIAVLLDDPDAGGSGGTSPSSRLGGSNSDEGVVQVAGELNMLASEHAIDDIESLLEFVIMLSIVCSQIDLEKHQCSN